MRKIRYRMIKNYILDVFCIIFLLFSAFFFAMCLGKLQTISNIDIVTRRCSRSELPRMFENITDKVYGQIAFIVVFYPNKMLEYHLCKAVRNYSIANYLINGNKPLPLIEMYFARGENEMTLMVAYSTWVKVNHGTIDKSLISEAKIIQKEDFQNVNRISSYYANNKELEQVLYVIKKNTDQFEAIIR